jgi:hypothetical protein
VGFHFDASAGEARWRYWRQVLIALLAGYLNAVRTHGLTFAAAIAAGWAGMLCWHYLNLQVSPTVDRALFALSGQRLPHWTPDTRMTLIWSIEATVRALMFAICGWLAAKVHRSYRMLVIGVLIATVLLWKVPWLQLRVFEDPTHKLMWYLTGVGAILLGGLWRSYRSRMIQRA